MYNKFTSMTQPGDIVYIARYLVSGAEASSLYLKVCNSIGRGRALNEGPMHLMGFSLQVPDLLTDFAYKKVLAFQCTPYSYPLARPVCIGQVTAVEGTEVTCEAQNAATLEGLLCVFHAERSRGDGLNNVQVG